MNHRTTPISSSTLSGNTPERLASRRDFISTCAAAATVAALGAASTARAEPEVLPRVRKGVNLAMITKPGASVTDRFLMARDAGFEGIEVNRPEDVPIDEIKKASAASGLPIADVLCSTHWDKPISHNDPAVRKAGMRGVQLALNDAGELGCTRLLLVPGRVNKETRFDDVYTRSQAAIRELIPNAEAANCKIAIENVWNQFILTPTEAARYVDEIGSPWVGWHFDIGNCVTYGWPEQWIRILGKRILNLHIKEFSKAKSFGVELGEGDIDWPAVVIALREIGYDGWGVLEVPGGDEARLKFLFERTKSLLPT